MSEKRNRETADSIDDDDDEIPEFQPGKRTTIADESRNTEDKVLSSSAIHQGDKMDRELGSIITRFSSLDGQHLGHKVGISLVVVLLMHSLRCIFFLPSTLIAFPLCTTADRCATEINSCTIGRPCKCTPRSRGRGSGAIRILR